MTARQKSATALMADALLVMRFGGDPLTVEEALHQDNPHRADWRAAMQEEWASIVLNKTFDYPRADGSRQSLDGRKPISAKWVFKAKRNPDGTTRYKARLVIRGFEQVAGVDFSETYAPVGKLTTLRYMLCQAALQGWTIEHLDVVTAFLNPALDNEVYMKLPQETAWLDPTLAKQTKHVKLLKALSGLKQAPRLWHQSINTFLLYLGFRQADADPNLYLGGGVRIILYVDDILVFYHPNNKDAAGSVKAALMQRYKMKDLGPAQQFLGLEISQNTSRQSITLSQEAYIDTILKRFEMTDAYVVHMPMDPNVRLDCDPQQGGAGVDPTYYQSIVGSLMYAALGTRPDIAYAVAALSRYNSRPLAVHLTAAKRVLRYLKATKAAKLCYTGGAGSSGTSAELHGYTDADWAGDSADRKSQGGFVFAMGGAAISWQSRKQSLIALSTLEAEYVACSDAVREAKWLSQLVADIADQPSSSSVTLYCDNQGALKTIVSGVSKASTKHIDVRFHNSRHAHSSGTVDFSYIPSNENTADICTKALPAPRHDFLVKKLGIRMVEDSGSGRST
jgi:hypothetical protein